MFTAIPLLAVPTDMVPVDVSILVFPATSKENVDVPSIVIASLASISSVEESMSMATSESPPIVIEPPSRVRAPSASKSIVVADSILCGPPLADNEPLKNNAFFRRILGFQLFQT